VIVQTEASPEVVAEGVLAAVWEWRQAIGA